MSFLSGFLQSLRGLEALTVVREPKDHIPFFAEEGDSSKLACPKLRSAVDALSGSADTQGPSFDREWLLNTWAQYKQNPQGTRLIPRVFKSCCWEPQIVADSEFRELIDSGRSLMSPSNIEGLLYSYHKRFKSLSGDLQLTSLLRTLISANGNNRGKFVAWNKHIDEILGVDAAHRLAEAALADLSPPEDKLGEMSLNRTTEFANRMAAELAALVVKNLDAIENEHIIRVLYGIFASPLLEREDFKQVISSLICSKRAAQEIYIQRQLIEFLLKNQATKNQATKNQATKNQATKNQGGINQGLGDPRIYPENWAGISEAARATVIQWLSKEDINLFFGLIMRDQDKHGRKDFWLSYADKIVRSRALLSQNDLETHAVRLEELREKGHSFGRFGGSAPASAFILEFKKVVAVEFSKVGNACYLYRRDDFSEMLPDFWAEEINFKNLKDQGRGRNITHSGNWQYRARRELQTFGVKYG